MKKAILCLSLPDFESWGMIYFIDRIADVIRDVLALEVEYHSILMKLELSITDTVVAAVKCRYFATRRRMKTRRGRKC